MDPNQPSAIHFWWEDRFAESFNSRAREEPVNVREVRYTAWNPRPLPSLAHRSTTPTGRTTRCKTSLPPLRGPLDQQRPRSTLATGGPVMGPATVTALAVRHRRISAPLG